MAAVPPGLSRSLLEPFQVSLEILELLTVEQQLGREDQSLESAEELVLKAVEGLSLAMLWSVVVVDQHSMGKMCCVLWEAAGSFCLDVTGMDPLAVGVEPGGIEEPWGWGPWGHGAVVALAVLGSCWTRWALGFSAQRVLWKGWREGEGSMWGAEGPSPPQLVWALWLLRLAPAASQATVAMERAPGRNSGSGIRNCALCYCQL